MHEDTFVGLARTYIETRVPEAARPALTQICTRQLVHGEHWRWIGGAERLTEAGLRQIIQALTSAGQTTAAEIVRQELEQALAAVAARSRPAEVSAGQQPEQWWQKW